MNKCQRCSQEKKSDEFYSKDSTCKVCRRRLVRENRARKIDYYRAFDRARANEPHRVEARKAYQKTERGKMAGNRAKKRHTERNPVKKAASVILNNAVRDGKVVKPGFCENCGATGRIHGHHDDYAKPLDVRWLCPSCHSAWHAENGEGANG